MKNIESPFIVSLADREREQRRHDRIREWAVIATTAAILGWLGIILVVAYK